LEDTYNLRGLTSRIEQVFNKISWRIPII